uniref:DUF6273 domain-containing protein n=1 Tax=uncultured bacterium contig00055 TaxID=1181539 RepID=A0A806K150_9BACT|nr:hypothetical protein [uncultured bacterium contig00055]
MANLVLHPRWVDKIYQIDEDDDILGGPGGVCNLPLEQLGDRTEWLKEQADALFAGLDEFNGEVIEPDLSAKLAKLMENKRAILEALRGMGVNVPDDIKFTDLASLISQMINMGGDISGVLAYPWYNPGKMLGGISWTDPNFEFQYIEIFEIINDEEISVAQVAPGVGFWEPEVGTHRYRLRAKLMSEGHSYGHTLPEMSFEIVYRANLADVMVSHALQNVLILQFDNFVELSSAEGFSVGGISESLEFLDQPDMRTVRLRLTSGIFVAGHSYTLDYDGEGDLMQADGSGVEAFTDFPIENHSGYEPASVVNVEVTEGDPTKLRMTMSRPVLFVDHTKFALLGTPVTITGVLSPVSDEEDTIVDFQLSGPILEGVSGLSLSMIMVGMHDDMGQPVAVFHDVPVQNNSTYQFTGAISAQVTAGNSRVVQILMSDPVTIGGATSGAGAPAGISIPGKVISSWAVSSTVLSLTVSAPIKNGENISAVYDGSNPAFIGVNNEYVIDAFNLAVTNNSTYAPATVVTSPQIPQAQPNRLIVTMTRAVKNIDYTKYALDGTHALITGVVSPLGGAAAATIEFIIDEPVNGNETAIRLSMIAGGMVDDEDQPVEPFSNVQVVNNSQHVGISVSNAQIASNETDVALVVLEGAVTIGGATSGSGAPTGWSILGKTILSWTISDGTVRLPVSTHFLAGETPSVIYDGSDPSFRAVANGDRVIAFNFPIQNNSTMQAVAFEGVSANGSASSTTTLLTLTFSDDIAGLVAGDVTLNAGSTGATKGALNRIGVGTYTLGVSGITAAGSVSVGVAKAGFIISGSPQSASVFFVQPITFSNLVANGSSASTTNLLTLTFSGDIAGLVAGDITINAGSTGATRGSLTRTGVGTYTLGVSGITASGQISVSVAKAGFAFTGSPKNVDVYFANTIPAGTVARNLETIVLGRAAANAQDITDVVTAVHNTVESGQIASLVLGDYFTIPISSGNPFTVAARGSYGAINVTANADLGDHGKHIGFRIVSKNGNKNKNGVTYDHVWFHAMNVFGYSGEANADGMKMNETNTNAGGMNGADGRQYLLLNVMPVLQAKGIPFNQDWIKGVPRKVANGGSGATGFDLISDKLTLPTEYEMHGTRTYSHTTYEAAADQGRWEYYDSNAKRIKYNKDNAARQYWCASPYSDYTGNFCYVYSSGAPNFSTAANAFGCAPAFCVA